MENPVDIEPSRPTRFVNWLYRHQVALAALSSTVVTATVLTKMRLGNHQEMVEFIEKEGLMDKFIETHPIIVK